MQFHLHSMNFVKGESHWSADTQEEQAVFQEGPF